MGEVEKCQGCNEDEEYCICHWYYEEGKHTKEEWEKILKDDDYQYVCFLD